MNTKKIKEIAYGERTCIEVDLNGKWHKLWGTLVKIDGYLFIFAPHTFPNGVGIWAYSLDSLKLFENTTIDMKTAIYQCATKEGFMKATAPLAIKIDKALCKAQSLDDWKNIFKSEYLTAIAECGPRNKKEKELIKNA